MKRNRLKLTRKVNKPPDKTFNQQTMDYNEAVRQDIWKGERKAADDILKHCKLLNLQMKLDKLTIGVGNCFMVAVLQQLTRPEVYNNLRDEFKKLADNFDQMQLRRQVVGFIRQEANHPQVIYMRERFAPDPDLVNGPKTSNDYWEMMLVDCNWASGDFVQATAWYLNNEIWIIDTSCTRQHPFIRISGNMDAAASSPTNVNPLLIGSATGNHFQSLLFDK